MGGWTFLDPKIFLSLLMWAVDMVNGVYPLECGVARTAGRLSRDRRRGGCSDRLVGELLQYDSWVRPIMKFQLIGVNHKTAPVEVRERLAIPESHLTRRRCGDWPGIREWKRGDDPLDLQPVEVLTQQKLARWTWRAFLRDIL